MNQEGFIGYIFWGREKDYNCGPPSFAVERRCSPIGRQLNCAVLSHQVQPVSSPTEVSVRVESCGAAASNFLKHRTRLATTRLPSTLHWDVPAPRLPHSKRTGFFTSRSVGGLRPHSDLTALCLVQCLCSVKFCPKKEYISHNALRMWAVQREAEVEVDFKLVVL